MGVLDNCNIPHPTICRSALSVTLYYPEIPNASEKLLQPYFAWLTIEKEKDNLVSIPYHDCLTNIQFKFLGCVGLKYA